MTKENGRLGLTAAARPAAAESDTDREACTPPAAFVQALFCNSAAEEVADRSAAELDSLAASLWHFAQSRSVGQFSLRMLWQARSASAGGRSSGVLQIVQEDMPFLVDSVAAVLTGFGLELGLLVHPVLSVRRDAEGRLLGIGPGAGSIAESMMHVEVKGALSRERCEAIETRLAVVLADVRSVHEDRERMDAFAREIATEVHAEASIEGREAAAFIDWLLDDNFIFFGTREYTVSDGLVAIVPGTGRGLLREDSYRIFGDRGLSMSLDPTLADFVEGPDFLIVRKSSNRSTVHRPVALDAVTVKRPGRAGAETGLKIFLGLFTPASLARSPFEIPLLRDKVRGCEARSGFAPDSHDGTALALILATFPRDELFRIDEPRLLEVTTAILRLRRRPQTRLFVLQDKFRRYATCLVYVQGDRCNAEIRRRIAGLLEKAFAGSIAAESTHFDDPSLARMEFLLALRGENVPDVDVEALERRLVEASRTWIDRLSEALTLGAMDVESMLDRYGSAFPASYAERFSATAAVGDIAHLEKVAAGAAIGFVLSSGAGTELRLKTFHRAAPVALSDILPLLENAGVRVLNESPFEVHPAGLQDSIWIQDFELLAPLASDTRSSTLSARFEEMLRRVWTGEAESDGLDALVVTAGLSPAEIVVLRTYCRFLRQVKAYAPSRAGVVQALNAHPDIARGLVGLFAAQFSPMPTHGGGEVEAERFHAEVSAALGRVEDAEEDRLLRELLSLVRHTLRTNFYQKDADGHRKPCLAVKLASASLDFLPQPRPAVEIFVYGPRVEGCHLRGGLVARGGIRWSDRKDDFRAEVLALMKAQMVKNSVIVPVGSKGGFVVKRPPSDPVALRAEVLACYQALIGGMLDLTDNMHGGIVVPPRDVVRRDGDDVYLVVAADKGTATFSDTANAISVDRGFWLGDAFASGGSAGYDHKAMGITAKGAWEAVKRHFSEAGADVQTQPFTCVGVGDMSGDVFGNGMLLSRATKLVAAFNHKHIFIDPDPDPERSFQERQRLFAMPLSTWRDYDPAALSDGGGVFDRSAKSIRLPARAVERFRLEGETISPGDLIRTLLRLDVDLLWFGGIGTYVRARGESDAEVGDTTNDALRIEADTLRAKVVGEGANLALTQRARIEYALAGGRINTDAIDNSAGVDTSDHEVNIKIALGDVIAAGSLREEERSSFLASMADEVEHLVLRDNRLQAFAISLAEAQSSRTFDVLVRLQTILEKRGKVDRALEFLPADEELSRRRSAGRGLVRPEIAVLLAYAKNVLSEELLSSEIADLRDLDADVLGYFPQRLSTLVPDVLLAHRLRREIVATLVSNEIINRMGPSFVEDMKLQTGRDAPAIAKAYLAVRDIFGLQDVWQGVEASGGGCDIQLALALAFAIEQSVRWLLVTRPSLAISDLVRRYGAGMREVEGLIDMILREEDLRADAALAGQFVAAGAEPSLADRIVRIGRLAAAFDIVDLSDGTREGLRQTAKRYLDIGSSSGLDLVRRKTVDAQFANVWERLTANDLIDETYRRQRSLTVATAVDGAANDLGRDRASLDILLEEVSRATRPDLSLLSAVCRRIAPLRIAFVED